MSNIDEKSFKVMNDDERIEHIQRNRHDIINMFMTSETGERVQYLDKDSGSLVRGLLKDMDSSIFTKRRLTVDEVAAENDKRVAEMAEQLMGRIKPIGRDKSNYEATSQSGPKIDETKLQHYSHTDGEIEPVGNQVDLDEIAREGRRIFKGVEDDSDN